MSMETRKLRKILNEPEEIPSAVGSISFEEILGGKDEEELPLNLRQHFLGHGNEKEEMYGKIEEALKRIEKRDPKIADVIRQKYQLGKTELEIAEHYGDTHQAIHKLKIKGLKILKGLVTGKIISDLSIPERKKPRERNNKNNPSWNTF